MEDTDQNDSDEVGEDEFDDLDFEGRVARLQRIIDNFTVRGPGMSGDVHEGFSYQGPGA